MELTNTQIEEACEALASFNPKVETKVKFRLARNLRHLNNARREKEYDRLTLLWQSVTDQTKRPEHESQLRLTPAEQKAFNEKYRELMKQTQEVEIHPIKVYDSEAGETVPECGIDISKVGIPNQVLAILVDAGVLIGE